MTIRESLIASAQSFALDFDLTALGLRIDQILLGKIPENTLNFKPKQEFKLTESQKVAFEIAKNNSILLTGEAGTGKSYLLAALIDYFNNCGRNVSVTASTGVAAVNVSGSTIFSWAGIGLGEKPYKELLKDVLKNKKAVARIKNANILIIDEISMLRGEVLDKLDSVFKSVRGDMRAFGGVHLILTGDFCQIPPVPRAKVYDFVFHSSSWKELNPKVVCLKEIVRQNDKDFTTLLSGMRAGQVVNEELLKSRFNAKLEESAIKPIFLSSRNVDVDMENKRELNRLVGKLHTFTAEDSGEPRHIETLDKNCMAAKVIDLKPGAQVMLLKNLDVEGGLCNGSMGVVVKIEKFPVVSFDGKEVLIEPDEWKITEQEVTRGGKFRMKTLACRLQIPLRLAYAATIHKTQGQTLSRARIDLTGAWEYGQHYVALSRVKRLEDVTIVPFDFNNIRCHPDCLNFYEQNSL